MNLDETGLTMALAVLIPFVVLGVIAFVLAALEEVVGHPGDEQVVPTEPALPAERPCSDDLPKAA
jgi:hypothetical protein